MFFFFLFWDFLTLILILLLTLLMFQSLNFFSLFSFSLSLLLLMLLLVVFTYLDLTYFGALKLILTISFDFTLAGFTLLNYMYYFFQKDLFLCFISKPKYSSTTLRYYSRCSKSPPVMTSFAFFFHFVIFLLKR